MTTASERFWSRVLKTDHCWNWTGSTVTAGYGTIMVDGVNYRAHRYSYLFNVGPIPDGMWVLHKCDNRACVNPAHLFLGDNLVNSLDRESKGRGKRVTGEAHWKCKFSDATIAEIIHARKSGLKLKEISVRFGICRFHAACVCRGEARKTISETLLKSHRGENA